MRALHAALGDAEAITDPGYAYQWQLHNTGQDFPQGCTPGVDCQNGTADADIDWAEAYDLGFRGTGVIIAIASRFPDPDSGSTVNCDHPDLAGRLWSDPGDPNVHGWNFADNDSDVCTYSGGFVNHDTSVALNAVAEMDGAAGVGAAPEARLMILLGITGSTGSDNVSFYRDVIPWVESRGGRVIFAPYTAQDPSPDCASFGSKVIPGGGTRSGILAASDVLVVWGCPGEFPGCDPSAVQLMATDENDVNFTNSCTSPDPAVDFSISSDRTPLNHSNALSWGIGTLAGAAALLLEEDPAQSRSDLMDRLRHTAEQVGAFPYVSGRNDEYGDGRVNIHDALMVGDVDDDGVAGDGDGTWVVGDGPCAGGTSGCDDNCPLEPNPSQPDSGGVGTGASADGIGDACQCGDTNGDGEVLGADADQVQDWIAGVPGALSVPAKCNVIGSASADPNDCEIDDWVILKRGILGLDPAGTLAQVCGPAIP